MKFLSLWLPVTLAAGSTLFSAGCTTTGYMRDAQPSAPPGPDQAKVVVYRTAAFGGGDHFPVYEYIDCEGKLLGFTETDCYFEYFCDPGTHVFLTWGEGDAFIEAELEGGKTYYIRAYSKFGLAAARPGFAPVARDSVEWRRLEETLPRLKCRQLDPAEVAKFERRKEERLKEAQAKFEEGRQSPRYLKPEDGKGEPALNAK